MKEEIKSLVPVDKVYDDALSPAMKQIGKALEGVAKTSRFLLAPIDYLASQHDRWQRHLQKVADKVPEENLIEGQPAIVIPVLESLSLQQEDSLLSEFFINLLSASIDKTKQDLAHPAFPNILSQLSHDEAVILYFLKKKTLLINTYYEENDLSAEPLLTDTYYYDKFIKSKLAFSQHFKLYLKHLKALEVVFFENRIERTGLLSLFQPTTIDTTHLEITQSPFGKLFADACIPDKFEGL